MKAAQDSRPAGNRAAVEVLAEGLTTPSVKPIQTNPSEPALIGSTVEKALDATVWRLKTGAIGLEEVTPAILALYTLGHIDGVASVAPQLAQAVADRDRYYAAAFSPKQPVKIGPSYAELQTLRAAIYGGTK